MKGKLNEADLTRTKIQKDRIMGDNVQEFQR